MSLTSTVPASVPSLFHSSLPFVPSSFPKNSVSPTTVNPSAREVPMPPRFLTWTVPAAVPSLFHSSSGTDNESCWRKNSVLPTAVNP